MFSGTVPHRIVSFVFYSTSSVSDIIHLTKEVDSDAQSPEETLQPAVTKVFQATGDPSAVDLVILT